MWDGSALSVLLSDRAKETSYLISSCLLCFASPSSMGRFLMLIVYWLILFC